MVAATHASGSACAQDEWNASNSLLGDDVQVDAWAVGILAFELIVGRPPFEQPSRSSTYEHIMYRCFWRLAAALLYAELQPLLIIARCCIAKLCTYGVHHASNLTAPAAMCRLAVCRDIKFPTFPALSQEAKDFITSALRKVVAHT